jgi:hypothetical protein
MFGADCFGASFQLLCILSTSGLPYSSMSYKTDNQQLRKAKGWVWWLRYWVAWRLPCRLSRMVQPRIFSDQAVDRALSSEVEPLLRPPTIH